MTPEQALAFYRAQYEKADGEATRLAMKVGALESQMRGQTFVTPDEKDARIAQFEARCRAAEELSRTLAFALKGLYDDQVDYLTLNKLGGLDNHWMRAARIALSDYAPETPAPEFDPAWVCGVCGKRHGRGECLGADK